MCEQDISLHPVTQSPTFEAVKRDLRRVVRCGIPVTPGLPLPALTSLHSVLALAASNDPNARFAVACETIYGCAGGVELPGLPRLKVWEAVWRLLGKERGHIKSRYLDPIGRDLAYRREQAAETLGFSTAHFRKKIEPKIIEQLAWLMLYDSFEYFPRPPREPPSDPWKRMRRVEERQPWEVELFDAGEADRVERGWRRESLLSLIWAQVHLLHADLVTIRARHELSEEDKWVQSIPEETEATLGRLLIYMDQYLEKFGAHTIQHPYAVFDVRNLVQLAGWPKRLTKRQATRARQLAQRLEQSPDA